MTSKANYGGNGVKYVDSFRLWLNTKNYLLKINGASLVAQMVKRLPAMQETWVRSLGWEGPFREGHGNPLEYSWTSLVAQMVKNQPAESLGAW